MEEAIKKLMEIEASAREIMQEAARTKEWMTDEMEQSCREYDSALEEELTEKLGQMHAALAKEKESRLSEQKKHIEKSLEDLELYYAQNHERLAEELFEKILRY